MPHTMVLDLAQQAMMTTVLLAAPMLLAALGIGLLVSVVQAVTQVQDQTVAFVAKLFAVAAAFMLALPWMLETVVRYTTELFISLPSLVN